MWKKITKTGCLLLAATLLLTACLSVKSSSNEPASGGTNDQNIAMGRFVEEELTLPEEAAAGQPVLCQGADGALTLFDLAGETPRRWDSADGGKSWAETALPWATGELASIYSLSIAPDGALWLSSHTGALYRVGQDGTVTPVKVAVLEDALKQGLKVRSEVLAISADRVLLGYVCLEIHDGSAVMAGSGNILCDGNGSQLADLGSTSKKALLADGKVYSYGYGSQLELLDPENGNVLESYDCTGLLSDSYELLRVQGNELYSVGARDLRKVTLGGSLAQVVLEGANFAFGDPTNTILDLQVQSETQMLMLLSGSSGVNSLLRYRFDKTLPTQAATSLRVWSLEDHELLRLAIGQFRRSHPQVDVTLEVALAEGSAQTAEDAVRALNTELLSGEGPDILILDGLPTASLVKNGMLADLSGAVDLTALEPAFTKPFATEQGAFMLPVQFTLPILAGSPEDLEKVQSLADLAALAETGPAGAGPDADGSGMFEALLEAERPVLHFDDLVQAMNQLWAASGPAVLNGRGELDQAAFRSFAQAVYAIQQKYGLSTEQTGGGSMVVGIGNFSFFIESNLFTYNVGGAQLGTAQADSLICMTFAAQGEGEIKALPGLAQGAYITSILAGVNGAGKHTEEALAFVNSLFSEEVQGTVLGSGLPTTKAGLAAQMAAMKEIVSDVKNGGVTGDPLMDLYDPTDLIGQLSTPVLVPAAVSDAVYTAIKDLCDGVVDLDGAVAQFAKEVSLYLAEQQ